MAGKGRRDNSDGINIGARSFLIAIGIIFILMVVTYVLTLVIPGGEYARIVDESGHTVIDTEAGFHYVEGGLPFWKWLLSPFLVLGAEGSGTIIAVLIFLLVIGGVFNSLTACGMMNYMLGKIVDRFGNVRYKLMAVLIFFFMALGSLVGSFEEVIPMAPIVVALAVALGWDSVTGIGMSLLATGFRHHALRIEKPAGETAGIVYTRDARMDKGLRVFAVILGIGIAIVLSSGFIKALQDYTMIIVALMFLSAGIASVLISGTSLKELGRTFLNGIIAIAPSILMILMASSIKYTMVEGKILDTILFRAAGMAGSMSKAGVVLFIYAICLVMNFFISSGSAKAFLLIPIIAPLAQLFGINMQLAIVAFAFGDGFSNVIYPTNAGLLITLGLSDVSYGEWFRYSWKFQTLNLILTSAILMFGLAVGY